MEEAACSLALPIGNNLVELEFYFLFPIHRAKILAFLSISNSNIYPLPKIYYYNTGVDRNFSTVQFLNNSKYLCSNKQ